MSKDLRGRLMALNTASPFELFVFGAYWFDSRINAMSIEQQAHRMLRHRHSHGEWFNVGVLKAIAAIYHMADINVISWMKTEEWARAVGEITDERFSRQREKSSSA